MTYATSRKLLLLLVTFVLVLCTVFTMVQSTFAYAEASAVSFDETNVLDDLRSSTVDGKPFDLNKYPYNELSGIQVINVVEYCYSYRANQRTNYGLYLYVYNPQGLNLSNDSKQNKVQIAVEYNSSGGATRYEKFNLQLCSKAEESNYKNLFYKYKVVDKAIDGKTFAERVNSNERRYDISGIELLTYGNKNATEYGVGGIYKFTGYSEGYGPDVNAKNTLSCTVENLETLELEVHHTYYRTNASTIIRKPNLRRFCDANNIHSVKEDMLHHPLYDFNNFLMKVNPKGIAKQMPVPNVMILVQAVNELQTRHPNEMKIIDRKFIAVLRTKGKFFVMRRLRTLYINYEEFEKQAETLLAFLKTEWDTDKIALLKTDDEE